MVFLGLFALPCWAQNFSADVVYLSGTAPSRSSDATPLHPNSKLYVNKDNLRLETHGLNGTVLLVNVEDQIAVAMFPSRKSYEILTSPPSEYFSVANPDDACADWQQASSRKISCKKVGSEAVNGRPAVKYQNPDAAASEVSVIWIDAALKYVIKWEGAQTGAELQNIKEGQQSADLFKVPRDFNPVEPRKGSKGFSKAKP
jgi:hypothetical protein